MSENKAYIQNGKAAKSVNAETANNALKFNGMGSQDFLMFEPIGSTNIPASADLNHSKYLKYGAYLCGTNNTAATLKNAPFGGTAFRMWVFPGTDAYPVQFARSYNAGQIAQRTWSGSSWWNSWTEFAQTESGTWTPELYGRVVAGNPTYRTKSGWFLRIGKFYLVNAMIALTNKGGMKGEIKLRGLPSAANNVSTGTSSSVNGIVASENKACGLDAEITTYGEAWIYVRKTNVSQSAALMDTDISDAFSTNFSAVYIAKNV